MNDFIRFLILEGVFVLLPFCLGLFSIKLFRGSQKLVPVQAECTGIEEFPRYIQCFSRPEIHYHIWVKYNYNGKEFNAPLDMEFNTPKEVGTIINCLVYVNNPTKIITRRYKILPFILLGLFLLPLAIFIALQCF